MKEINLTQEIQIPVSTSSAVTSDNSVFKLDGEFSLPLRISSFESEKDYCKYIKTIERMVRSSPEYREWVRYVTVSLGHTVCEFTQESMNECSIEVHHHPITMYTLVSVVINNDFLDNAVEFSSADVVNKVLELHYQNKVGYCVMLSNLHEKYHGGFLDIPMELVHGNYKYILDNYKVPEQDLELIYRLCAIHSKDVTINWSKDNYPGIKKLLSAQEETKQLGGGNE